MSHKQQEGFAYAVSLIQSNSEQMALRAVHGGTCSTSLSLSMPAPTHHQQGGPQPPMQPEGQEAPLLCPPLAGVQTIFSYACLILLFIMFWKR